MNNPIDPLKPVVGVDGRMITAVVNQETLPKVPAQSSIPPPPPGFTLDQPVTQSAIPPPPAGFVLDQPSVPAVVPSPPPGFVLDAPTSAPTAVPATPTPIPQVSGGALATAGRELGENIAPAGAGLAGAWALGEAGAAAGTAIAPGPGTIIGAAAGAIGGYIAGEWGGAKLQRWIQELSMSPEDLAAHDAALAAGRQEHPFAAGMGSMAASTPGFFTGAGVGKAVLTGGKVVKAGFEATKAAKLAAGLASSGVSFGAMGGGGVAVEKAKGTPGAEQLSIPGETVKGIVVGGTIGLVPGFKSIFGKFLAKPAVDAVALATANGLYDRVVKGTPFDPTEVVKQSGQNVAPFVVMNAVMSLLHARAMPVMKTDYQSRIESLGIPKEQIGDWAAKFAAAKDQTEFEKVTVDFANTFKDVLPPPPVDPIIQNQTEHMTGEIAKVTDPVAAKYFEDTYLSQLQSGQPLTEEQANAAHSGILDAIEKTKANQPWAPPVEPVQAEPAPNLPPPVPTIQPKVENPAPVPAGEPVTQPIIEASAGAKPLTSPTTPAPITQEGRKASVSPEVGAGTISKKQTIEERRAVATGQEMTGIQFIKDNGGIKAHTGKDLSEELFGNNGKGGAVDISLRNKMPDTGRSADEMAAMMHEAGFLPEPTERALLDYLNNPNTKLTKTQLDLLDQQKIAHEQGIIEQGKEAERLAPIQAKKFAEAQARLKTKGQEVSTPMMEIGDSFTIEGEKYKVTATDEQGFRVEDGTTFWIPYKRPVKGEKIFVDKGSYKMAPIDTGEIKIANRTSRSQGPAKGIPAKQAQYLADEMMKAWVNKPMGGAIVVQSEADIDKLGLSDESRQAILDSKAEGFYHIPTETVVIIADNLNRPSDAIRVMIHESIGHYGIQKVLGAEFQTELDRIGKLIPEADLQKVADDYNLNMADPTKRLEAIEEYLAKEAPLRNPTLWQQFVKAIRAALERIGVKPDILNKWDTRGEIDKLIDTARDYMERGPAKPTEAMSGEVRMSKPADPSKYEEVKENEISNSELERIISQAAINFNRERDDISLSFYRPKMLDNGVRDPGRMGTVAAGEIAKAFGKDLIFFRSNLNIYGFSTNVVKDKIFISVDSQRPELAVVGHELVHEMRKDNPELYDQFEKELSKYSVNIENYQRRSTNKSMSEDELKKDFVPDIVGDQFIKPEFWKTLKNENPTLFSKVADYVLQFIQKVRAKLSEVYGTEKNFMPKDLEKVRSILADHLNRYAESRTDTREFKLEQETEGMWRSRVTLEKQNAEAKRQSELLKAKVAEPIKGGMGDTTGSLFKGENDLFGIRMSLREHGPSKHISEDEKIAPAIRKMALDMEYEQRNNKELYATVEKRVGDNPAKAHDDFINNKNLLPDELVVTGKILQFRYSESTLTAEDAGDIPLATKYAKAAHEITKALNEYALQYGRAGEAFRIEAAPLSSRTGARTKLEGMNEDYAKEVMKKDGRFEVIRKGFQEDNAKAIDGVLSEPEFRKRLAEAKHRLATVARNGADALINSKSGKQSAQEWLSRPENSEVNDAGVKFSLTGRELDEKIFDFAKRGIRVMLGNGNTGFTAFHDVMIKKFGPNIEEHLPEIYDETSIMVRGIVAGKATAKGSDTRNVRGMNAEIKSILKGWFAAGDKNTDRKPVLDLLQAVGMTEKDAFDLAFGVQRKFIERADKLKNKRVQALGTGRAISINNPKAIRRILDLSNLGPLNEPMVLDAIAKAYNLKGVTPEIGAKLDELSKKIKNAPEGSPTDDATREMLNFMRKQMPRDWTDMGWGVWYSFILSGYQTEERNFVGTAMNSLSDLTSSMAAEPRNAPFALAGFIRGFGEGFHAAVDAWKTGHFPVRAGKFESSQVLELNPFTGGLKILNNMKYVLRLLQASDMLFFKASQESRSMMIAANIARENPGLSGTALWKEVALIAGTSEVQRNAFMHQATELEGRTGSAARVRAQELAERQRPIAMQEESTEYGKHSSLNFDPEGMAGVFSRKVSDLVREVPGGKFVIPFTRIVANVSNISIDHTPWGFVRLIRGIKNSKGVLEPITGHRRAQLVAKATMGTVLMTAVYMLDAMGGDDDKDKLFRITGAGTGDFNKDNQLKETGWRPWSFKIRNGPWIDYRLTPLAIGFAIMGSLRDAQRYKKMDEKTIWDRFSYAMLKSASVIFNMSFLSGINQVMALLDPGSPEGSGKKLLSYLTRIGSSIAIPAILKQLDRTFDDSVRDNATIAEGLMREVPIVSHDVKPKLNLLGEPIKQTTGPVSIFFSKENSDPVWRLIVDKEAFISKPSTSTKIDFGKNERIMTEDEYYQYVQESGKIIRERIDRRLSQLQIMTKERAGKIIDDIVQDARRQVKLKIQGKVVRERVNKNQIQRKE